MVVMCPRGPDSVRGVHIARTLRQGANQCHCLGDIEWLGEEGVHAGLQRGGLLFAARVGGQGLDGPCGELGELADQQAAAEAQEVDTSTYGIMQSHFVGAAGAVADLLFVLLFAAGVAPPKQVFGHGFITVQRGDGGAEKMSKSGGNAV